MTALQRGQLPATAVLSPVRLPGPRVGPASRTDHELWQQAAGLRQEWLDHSISVRPADRSATEQHLAGFYERLGRRAPRFVWVRSPREALTLVQGLPTLDDLYAVARDPRPRAVPPLASDLAVLVSRLRAGLSAGVRHPDPELTPVRRKRSKGGKGDGDDKGSPWPELPVPEALRAGVPIGVVLHQHVRGWLHRALGPGLRNRVRDVLAARGPVPVCWYGQHDSPWIAYYDILARLGLASYGPGEAAHLAGWAGLARSGGWWWPGDDVCVVVERPATLTLATVPGSSLGDVRLVPGSLTYRDGWRPATG